jgi:hypothetical protein
MFSAGFTVVVNFLFSAKATLIQKCNEKIENAPLHNLNPLSIFANEAKDMQVNTLQLQLNPFFIISVRFNIAHYE